MGENVYPSGWWHTRLVLLKEAGARVIECRLVMVLKGIVIHRFLEDDPRKYS